MNVTDIQLCSGGPVGPVVQANFPIKNPKRTDPYIVKGATGLDADEIIKTYNDGPLFYRVRPKQRVVVLLLKMNPDYNGGATISDLRDHFYRAIAFNSPASTFNSDSKIELRFYGDGEYKASLFGTITKMESSSFASETDLQLTIECENPFLVSNNRRLMSDEIDLTPDGASHVYNTETYLVGSSVTYTDNKSTAPHGFELEFKCISLPTMIPMKMILWDNRNPSIYIFSAQFNFVVNDIVQFSSEEDNRHINVIRGGVVIASLLNNIYWGSIWPYIWPGDNKIEVSEGMHITAIAHRDTYWGV